MRINIEIGDIEAFIELTETNSFAKAATNLNLSQPALSRRIQKLEQELGTKLFDRTTRKVLISIIFRSKGRYKQSFGYSRVQTWCFLCSS